MKKIIILLFGTLFIMGNLIAQTGTGDSKPVKLNLSKLKKKSDSIELVKNPPNLKEPPQIMVISPSSTPFNTFSEAVEIIAKIKNVEKENDVRLKFGRQNITKPSKHQITTDGLELSWNINLNEGSNEFVIIAKNPTKEETSKFKVIYQKSTLPIIKLITPTSNNSISSTNSIKVTAFFKNLKSKNDVVMKIRNQISNIISREFPGKDGIILYWDINLNEGINEFEIIASNELKTVSHEFTVNYQKPLPPAQISIITPSDNPYSTSISLCRIAIGVKNINNESDVVFKHQNKKVQQIPKVEKFLDSLNFSWDIDLNEGANEFEIIAINNSKQPASQYFAIIYNKPDIPKLSMNLWAVIVGISKYQYAGKNLKNLKYAADDAQYYYDFLKSNFCPRFAGEKISLLINEKATRENIYKELNEKLSLADPNDLVILYFACHGVTPVGNRIYFVCYDTKPENPFATALPHNDIQELLKNTQANKKIWIVDACHSGAVDDETRGENSVNKLLIELATKEGSPIFTSSRQNEYSLEGKQWGGGHGVFTYFFVDGLKGAADADKNHIVTIDEIYEYVRDNVKKQTKGKQIPELRGKYDPYMPMSIVK
jgi:hypothetical protein